MDSARQIQIGNVLFDNINNVLFRVIGVTDDGVIYKYGGTQRYAFLKDVSEVPLTIKYLKKFQEYIEDYKEIGDGDWCLIPVNSMNVYRVRYLHQLQNILSLHGWT